MADFYNTWIAQLVERSYVKQETLGLAPGFGLYLSAIEMHGMLEHTCCNNGKLLIEEHQ